MSYRARMTARLHDPARTGPRRPGGSISTALLLVAALAGAAGCGDNAAGPHFEPEVATLKVGGRAGFRVVDAGGAPLPATLSVVGAGVIDDNGWYQAPRDPTTDTIQARAAGGVFAEATAEVAGYAGRLEPLAPSGARAGHAASLLDDGSVLVVGGALDGRLERFVPAERAFRAAGALDVPRWSLSATELPGGGVLIAGGRTFRDTLAAAVTYADERVEAAGPLLEARFAHGAAALAGGDVLLAGGLPRTGSEVPALASAERYDPAARRFRATGAMSVRRADHTVTRLRDGRVLVVGGRDSTCIETCPQVFWATAELYDPVTEQFAPTGAMALARASHTATLLDDGRVLIAGGTTPDLGATDLADSVEIYDPATGAFHVAGGMQRRRAEHTATLLGDGTVLLAHGRTEGEGTLASATVERFDPRTGASVVTASTRTTRFRHTATRLWGGEVLLVGGTEGGGEIHAVELYD